MMRKILLFGNLFAVALALCLNFGCTKNDTGEDADNDEPVVPEGYVNLGLPDGTFWAESNVEGYYDQLRARFVYGERIPTKEQFEVLINSCTWTWNGSGYTVVGPNGRSISLPANGFDNRSTGMEEVGACGRYWSSDVHVTGNGDTSSAWSLFFNSGRQGVTYDMKNFGYSIRLVTKSK